MKRKVFDVLRRGVDNTIANWQLVLIRLGEMLLFGIMSVVAVIAALEEHFTGKASWTSADGGLFTFLTFHEDVDTAARLNEAVARGVAYIPGGPFFVDGSGRNTMRLTFAKESDERIVEGMSRLGEVFVIQR